MRRAATCACVLPLWVGVAGCRERQGTPQRRFESVPTPSAARGPASDLFKRDTLTQALSAIRRRVGEAASVLVLELTRERATIQVEAPSQRGSVVQYEWDGALKGPIPVELRGSGALDSNLFPLSAVDLRELPTLARAAVERIDREHGQVERIVVRRNLPIEEAIGIRVYVKSPIRSSHLDADARGRITDTPKIP